MTKKIAVLLFFLSFFFTFAQHKKSLDSINVAYMNIKTYQHYKIKVDSKVDSIGFKIDKNDTIIMVKGYKSKGVQVPYEEKDSIFLERYKNIVFNKKYQKKNQKVLPTMKTWKSEIKIYVDKSVDKNTIKKFKEFTKYIDQEVDSLKISFVRNKSKSNYFIYGMKDATSENFDVRILNKEGYYLEWNGKQNITNCSLKLNMQDTLNEDQKLNSLEQNFVLTLGYFYLERNFTECTSYFSICRSLKKTFSNNDLEILKYHYSYGICKGTNLETFEKNHAEAKAALKKDNTKFYFSHE
ncbi:hypothetical protein [Flavobacterium sp.]|uniref:hypothetical protein n=1 Tax=Flavobacterium sp. TaxID=239 RepID=UPI002636156C|nr:hypothetical protein [Flavobacterium sp.]MDG2431311.1 hypothetical protein [Flavobacterium sp.]